MKRYLALILVLSTFNTYLFSAEAGMPQLDPKYWASQAFWLILLFTILYISIAKFYLPKIKKNLDDIESKIKEDLDEANKMKSLSEKKSISRYVPKIEQPETIFKMIEKKPKIPSSKEMKENFPSRSAKLRYAIKKTDFYDFKTDILDQFSNLIEIENLGNKL